MTNRNFNEEVLSFLEQKVKNILNLGQNKIDPHQNLFEVGLHSLAILKLVFEIRSEYDIEIDIKDLFLALCLYELASLIATRLARSQ